MNQVHIPGFLNQIPCIYWQIDLPRFRDEKDDNASIHLIIFHIHMHRLGLNLPKDCLMNMFIKTLEDDVRSWYEELPTASLCSLKYFHVAFCDNYKQHYLSLLLIEKLCGKFEQLFQFIGIDIDDEELVTHYIEEVLSKFSLHQDEREEINNVNS
jgi:hypothetical protein